MIKISTRVVSVDNRNKFIEFLKGEYFPCDVREENDEIIIDMNDKIKISDAFEKGIDFGIQTEREKWEKPDEFLLPNKYAEMFKKAISNYCKESGIHNDSIKVNEIPNKDCMEVIVHPTSSIFLFNIASRYGKMVVKDEVLETLDMCMDIFISGKYPTSANDESFKKLQETIKNLIKI